MGAAPEFDTADPTTESSLIPSSRSRFSRIGLDNWACRHKLQKCRLLGSWNNIYFEFCVRIVCQNLRILRFGKTTGLTCGPSVGCSMVRTGNLIIRIGCALVVCRISRSGVRKLALRLVWIVNDKGRYHAFCFTSSHQSRRRGMKRHALVRADRCRLSRDHIGRKMAV